ncbi:MAG: polyamine aminopropyltransferase [Verrucomicrobiota bacterium]|nr:polyamine aminopropyltransferase [Verrucomicrobiota bacterium]
MNKNTLPKKSEFLLLFCILIIAICGLVYELLAGALSSYFLGDSVYQFSIVIGLFMTFMGVGSFLSRFFDKNLPFVFIVVEVLTGLIGGFSTIILFAAFAKINNYSPILFLLSGSIGTLIGLEIPLIIRILKDYSSVKTTVSNVMTADYIGGLAGALLFPILLVPKMGLIKTAIFFGLFNIFVASLAIYVFRKILLRKKSLCLFATGSAILLVMAMYYSTKMTSFLEDSLYKNEIIYAEETPYQRIVITRFKNDLNLYLNGSIQFSTKDEYRYHESLVHPAMLQARHHENILILGGGDGMALREIFKYDDVKSVTLVDLDKAITNLFSQNKMLTKYNKNSLSDKRVKIVNTDAWKFMEENMQTYDVILIDLPDPRVIELSKLYTKSFYRMLAGHLAGSGVIVTQATSPLFSRKAFWCIEKTLASVNSPVNVNHSLYTMPYHLYIPSFGEWGFVMASPKPIKWENIKVNEKFKFLTQEILESLITFPPDMQKLETEANTINSHKITVYYEKGWQNWYE